MSSDPRKPPVRVRVRPLPIGEGGSEARLIADQVPPGRRKRLPNAGSMKPGETRNPNGRPKGAKGTRAIARKVLGARTTVRENGRPRSMTIFEAMLRKELQLASEGDWRARKTILELGRWAFIDEAAGGAGSNGRSAAGSPPAAEQSEVDRTIIAWFEEEVARRREESEAQ